MSHHNNQFLIALPAGCQPNSPGLYVPGLSYELSGLSQGTLGNYRLLTVADSQGVLSEHVTIYPDGDPDKSWEAVFDFRSCQLLYVQDKAGNQIWGIGNINGFPWFAGIANGNKLEDSSFVSFGPGVTAFNGNVIEAGSSLDLSQPASIAVNEVHLNASDVRFDNTYQGSFQRSRFHYTNAIFSGITFINANVFEFTDWALNFIGQGVLQGNTFQKASIQGSVTDDSFNFSTNSVHDVRSLTINVVSDDPGGFDFRENHILEGNGIRLDGGMNMSFNGNDIKGSSITVANHKTSFVFSRNQVDGSYISILNSVGFSFNKCHISGNSSIGINTVIVNSGIGTFEAITMFRQASINIGVGAKERVRFSFSEISGVSAVDISGGPNTVFDVSGVEIKNGVRIVMQGGSNGSFASSVSTFDNVASVDFQPASVGQLVINGSTVTSRSNVISKSGSHLVNIEDCIISNQSDLTFQSDGKFNIQRSSVDFSRFTEGIANKSAFDISGSDFNSSDVLWDGVGDTHFTRISDSTVRNRSRIEIAGPAASKPTISRSTLDNGNLIVIDCASTVDFIRSQLRDSNVSLASSKGQILIQGSEIAGDSTGSILNINAGTYGYLVNSQVFDSTFSITSPFASSSIENARIYSGALTNGGWSARRILLENASSALVANVVDARKTNYPALLP